MPNLICLPRKFVAANKLTSPVSDEASDGKFGGGSEVLTVVQTIFGVSTLMYGKWYRLASSSMLRVDPPFINSRARYSSTPSLPYLVPSEVKPFRLVVLNCLKAPTIACIRVRARLLSPPR